MINHNKCRKENNEIHFTMYNEWFIHTVMENILKELRLTPQEVAEVCYLSIQSVQVYGFLILQIISPMQCSTSL